MIIVTGAAGFIGSAFVWELNRQGWNGDILCVDNFESIEGLKNLSKQTFKNYVERKTLLKVLPDLKNIEAIVHMGACSSTTVTDRNYVMEINTDYTRTLWNWCTKNGVRFIYASSAATYGDGTLGYDDEFDSNKLKPLNLYGESKVLFDRWALGQTETPPSWVGLKFFNVYGPHEYHKEEMSSVIYKAFHQINQTGKLKLFKSYKSEYPNGGQMRDFVYIKDVTFWIWQILQNTSITGIFNMGFGQARTWNDLAENVFINMGKPKSIEYIEMPENIRNQYQYFTEAKIDKLLKAGCDKPQWNLENGIQDYVQNYLMQEDPYL